MNERRADHHFVRSTWPLRWPVIGTLVGCWVAMVAIWSALGWFIVHVLDDTPVQRTDDRLDDWFVTQRTPRWDSLSHAGSLLAETAVKIVVTAILALALLRLCRRWLEALVVSLALVLEAMVFITVTFIVGRNRPDVPRLDGSPVGSSFPSGHVAAAACYTALAVVVFWHTRKFWPRALVVGFSVVTPLVVGVARMYRGMHFLTDVLAGLLLGLTSVLVVTVVLSRAESRRLESCDVDKTDGCLAADEALERAPLMVPNAAVRRELGLLR